MSLLAVDVFFQLFNKHKVQKSCILHTLIWVKGSDCKVTTITQVELVFFKNGLKKKL